MIGNATRRLLAAAAIASGALAAAPAGAAIIVATYTGKVQFGYDTTGMFGTPSRSLTGLAATFTFTFDTATPEAIEFLLPPYYGELRSTDSQAAGTAVVTIGDASVSLAGTVESAARQIDGESRGHYDQVLHLVSAPRDGAFRNSIGANVLGPDIVDTWDYRTPLEYDVTRADSATGTFEFMRHYADVPTVIQDHASATVYMSHVSIRVLGPEPPPTSGTAVPEPASWAIMIAGFGLAGGRLRRRARFSGRSPQAG